MQDTGYIGFYPASIGVEMAQTMINADRGFRLVPFGAPDSPPTETITGNIARRSNVLTMSYMLVGPSGELLIPGPAALPTRRYGLWEETCFELFLAPKNALHYWEFNLSPAGHWNVYRFESCRQGMREEAAISSLPFDIEKQAGVLTLALEFSLGQIMTVDQVLDVAISAVIKHQDGGLSYWALTHCGPQADFHRRDSFIVAL
jgi:hypothetical protein